MAIILERDKKGNPSIIKSSTFPPTKEELIKAEKLDKLLKETMPKIEIILLKKGILKTADNISLGGDIELWYNVGLEIKKIIGDVDLVKPTEYIWALQAARLYAPARILRKDRGSRLHLDYCIRVSDLPWKLIKEMNWGDWVYFFDSKSLRTEKRADKWIQSRIERLSKLDRKQFRATAQHINSELKDIDTSLYSDKELFDIYDSALDFATKSNKTVAQ